MYQNRKIDNYYKHLFRDVPDSKQDEIQTNNNNQHSFYEYVVQVGDKDSAGFTTNPENARIAVACLQEYIEGFIKRNHNLYVFNAVIHCDEATPHLHLDVIPFAEGYKKGMEQQLSIAKAFEAMGYDKNCDTASRDFTTNERKIFREICEQHGLEIEREEKSRGITFTPQQMRDGISELYDEITTAEKNLQKTKQELQEEQSTLSEVTTTVNALQKEKQELQKAVDLVRNFTPSPTKKVKDFLGREKEVKKTEEELKNEKLILTAQTLLAQKEKIISEANEKARFIVSSAEAIAQEIISKAENSEIVLTTKAEAEQILQEAKTTKEIADDYYKECIAIADEEAEERSRQLDEREAHINALAELSKPTAEYEDRMQWLYDMPVRQSKEELSEEIDEPEEDFEIYENEIEPDYYDGYEF